MMAGRASLAIGIAAALLASVDASALVAPLTSLPTLSVGNVSLAEGNSGTTNFAFPVTLSAASTGTVTVHYATADGTAKAATGDYVATAGTLTFTAGQTSATVNVLVNGDTLFELDENFFLNLSAPANASISVGQGVGTILNDDPMPSVSIDDVSALEGNAGTKSFTFAVSLSTVSGATTLVPYGTADGTATAPLDYVATAGTLTIPAGVLSGKVNVAVKGDTVIEPDETFFVNLGAPTNATITKGQGTGTIVNDDSPVLEFSAAGFKVSEAAGFATIAVKRTEGVQWPASVDYATSDGSATSSPPNPDYTSVLGTLTFAPGVAAMTFRVPIVNDTLAGPNKTVLLNLSNPQPVVEIAALGAQSTAVLTIVDNDLGGKVQFLPAAHTVNAAAGATSVKLTVTRTGGLASGVTVHCTMVDGTATGGVDYDNTPQDLTFLSSGVGATTQTLTIPIFQDTTGAKNFTVTLNPPSGGAVLGAPSVAAVTILGAEPTVAFGNGAYSVQTTQPTAMITVKRSPPLTGTVTVAYAATGGTAAGGGVDYTLKPGTLTFGPNVSSRTFAVSIAKDPLVDAAETVTLALGTPAWSLGTAVVDSVLGASVLTITDPNVTPSVQFSAATYTVNEATPQILISVKRTGDPVGTVTVDYAATGGTASNGGVDYTLNPGTLTFLPNQVMRTFPISIVNDKLMEGTETVQLQLTNPTWTGGSAVPGPIAIATLNILSNEPAVQFGGVTYSVREGAKSMLVAVRRTGIPLTGTATVTYDVTGGSAVRDTGSGGDYSLAVPGSLTFAPGQSTKTIPITLEPGKVADGNETIDLALSSPSGAGLGTPSTTTVTILDSPPPRPTPPGLIDTVYLIMLENTDWSSATNPTAYIKNNPILPYINSLIQSYAAADNFHAPYHPSMPNYLALETGGDNLGRTASPMPFKYTANIAITDGCFEPFPGAPTDGSVDCRNGLFRAPLGMPHLSKSINAAGYIWKQYNGDPPGLGTICPNVNRHIDDYSADHSPNLYFDDVTGSDPLLLTLQPASPLLAYCIAHLRPLAELVGDLQNGREANYNFIIPKDQDQGEKCPCGPNGRLGNADTFMQQLIPEIMGNSPAWARGSAVIFIEWDEPDNSNNTDPSGLIVISPHVKKGYLSPTNFPNGHASLVKTILEAFGLPLIGKTTDPANPDLSEFFTVFP